MPKTETAAYQSERQKLQTSPIYFVRFYHVKKAGDGTDYAFSRDFASGTVAGSTKDKLLALSRVSGNVQTVDPIAGRSSQGGFTIDLLDLQGEIGKHLAAPALTLAGAMDAVQLTATLNEDPSGLPAKGTIEITTSGVVERARYTSYNATTKVMTLSARGVDGTTAASHGVNDAVTNGEQIRPGQRGELWAGYAPLNEVDYRQEQKMQVYDAELAEDWVTFVVAIGDIQRFLKRQVFTGATRDAPVTLTGNPVTLALQVLTSTGAGTNGAYDVLPAANGLAIPQTLIDVAGLESLRDTEFSGQVYDVKLNAPEEGKTFIEREFWRTLNGYPFLTQAGKYSAKRLKPAPNPGGVSQTLTEDEIIAFKWKRYDRLIINQVDFRYDWNLTDNPDFWGKRQFYTSGKDNGGSYDRYGPRQAIVIESKGIKTASGGQTILDDRAAQFFKRHADPPPSLEVAVFYAKNHLEIGDHVKVTHSKAYHHKTGLRGLTNEVFEVVDVRPLYGAEGKVLLTLLHTGAITLPAAPTSGGALSTPNPERDATAPAVPTGLVVSPTAEIAGDGTYVGILDITWTANSEGDLSHYIVRYRKQGTAAWQDTFAGKLTSPRQILRGMQSNTTYEVQAAAVDTSNNASAFSSTVTATTPADPGAPAAPTGVTATAFITDIRVTWNVNPETDIDGYQVERADDSGFASGVVTLSSKHKSTFFLDGGLGRGVTKYYRIKAVRRANNATSAASSVVSATTVGVGGADVRTDQVIIGNVAQLDALIVKTSHIDNLSVTTLKVAGAAVNALAEAYTAGSVSIGAETTLQTVIITPATTDSVVEMFGAAVYEYTDPSTVETAYLRIYRGTTLVAEVVESEKGETGASRFRTLSMSVFDSPATTNSVTYYLKGAGNVNASRRRLRASERKR